jgi:GntR family transcriptional repressor for pyruvate dehydrogenase complex
MENREYAKVIEYIKTLIKEGQLELGHKLPTERDLAETLNLGRYSVREALRIMDNMGFIESRQGSGNYLIMKLSKNIAESMEMMLLVKQVNFHEINQVRRAMELQAFQLAAENITPEALEGLKVIYNQMLTASEKEKVLLDKKLHDEILQLSGNKLMISMMEALAETCQNLIAHVLNKVSSKRKEELMKAHYDILASLGNKDMAKGKEAINKHYDLIDEEFS